jgi:endonuclease/exonuclease/phosphatase family metal-dependent hydrolase
MLEHTRPALVATILTALTACDVAEPTGDEAGDAIDAPLWSKADAGGCPQPDTPAALGVLALVNDPDVDVELLDDPRSRGGIGLDRRAAEGIVQARPIASLGELDSVPYVGTAACRALVQRACNDDGRCRRPLRIATWNVEHFPLTATATTAVPQVIQQLQLDVVALQEIEDTEAFEDVLDALPGYTGWLAEPGPFTRVAVIARDDALDVLDVHSEFVDDGWAFPRPPLVLSARMHGALDETPIRFVALHLKARVDDTSRSRRALAVEKLRGYVDEARLAGPQSMVLLGDWNDALTDPSSYDVFGPLRGTDTEFLTEEAAELGIPTLIPFSTTIDHIMVTDEVLQRVAGEQTAVVHLDDTLADYQHTVSDHRPVMTTLAIPVGYDG